MIELCGGIKKVEINYPSGKCPSHGSFHADHGCGMAVRCGSANAEHNLGHDGIGFGGYRFDNVETRLKKGSFNPWEAPAGHCPICWHEAQEKEAEGFALKYAELKFYHLKREEIARELGCRPMDIELELDNFGNYHSWWTLSLKKRVDSAFRRVKG